MKIQQDLHNCSTDGRMSRWKNEPVQDAVSQPSVFTCPISIMNQCLESAYMVCVEEVNVAISEVFIGYV